MKSDSEDRFWTLVTLESLRQARKWVEFQIPVTHYFLRFLADVSKSIYFYFELKLRLFQILVKWKSADQSPLIHWWLFNHAKKPLPHFICFFFFKVHIRLRRILSSKSLRVSLEFGRSKSICIQPPSPWGQSFLIFSPFDLAKVNFGDFIHRRLLSPPPPLECASTPRRHTFHLSLSRLMPKAEDFNLENNIWSTALPTNHFPHSLSLHFHQIFKNNKR